MTSLLPARSEAASAPLRHRRPLALVSALGGAAAAGVTLAVCVSAGVIGWYLADGGAHGAPRGGLHAGALAWLMAHGSGVVVGGTPVTVVPIGLTLACWWACWRIGLRVGDSVSGHGPDADRIADGERDWTVPAATVLFALGYLAVLVVTLRLVGGDAVVSGSRAVTWTLVLCLVVAGPAIAGGSGRLAVWSAFVPDSMRASLAVATRVLIAFTLVSTLTWVISLGLDAASAANVMSQLHLDTTDGATYLTLSTLVMPNATLYAGSYLLGPGFSVGAGTLVSPTAVVLGPLPLFPLLAALPDGGATPAWTAGLMALPPLTALLAGAWAQRRWPTSSWTEAAVRGASGGVLAGLGFAMLAAISGGRVGPGRLHGVGPIAGEVLVHAVPAFAVGGLLGSLLATAWRRRGRARRAVTTP